MAHLLEARQSGAVASAKISFSNDQYHLVVDVSKWDASSNAAVRVGERKVTVPAPLFKSYSVAHLKEQLGSLLPPVLPGADCKGNTLGDDGTLASQLEGDAHSEQTINLVFNVDPAGGAAKIASPRQESQPSGLSRTTSVAVKAGSGPITFDRELAVGLSIWQDSGNNYVTVTATNSAQNINFEGKVTIAENYWSSMTVKELKRKLGNSFPATSDRGTYGTKNIKDTDKWGALGIKGKKGDTVKFSVTFELGGGGGDAVSSSSSSSSSAIVTGEAAPELDAKQRFNVEVNISLLEGNVFLKFVCTSEVVPELVKSVALPKVSYQVFNVKDLHNLLKGPQWPILQGDWAIFENASGSKIKVSPSTPLMKLGVTHAPGKSQIFKFIFSIDPHAALPSQ